MADITALAVSARRKYASGEAISLGIAIRKAINGVGIFHGPDVKRLMRKVGTHIAREGRTHRRRR